MATNAEMETMGFHMANSGRWVRRINWHSYTWTVTMGQKEATNKTAAEVFDYFAAEYCQIAYNTAWQIFDNQQKGRTR